MLYFNRQRSDSDEFCNIGSSEIDDFYYQNLAFEQSDPLASRLTKILDRITYFLRDQRRSKILGHEAIHLVLLVDSLLDDYTPSWELNLATAFDRFREESALAKLTSDDLNPSEYWLRYGVLTRASSDRADTIRRRHEFFTSKMRDWLGLVPLDPRRTYGQLERELIYFRDRKRCAVCGEPVVWGELEIHHIEEHAKGGLTSLENGVVVHPDHHPKGQAAIEFANARRAGREALKSQAEGVVAAAQSDVEDDDDQDP